MPPAFGGFVLYGEFTRCLDIFASAMGTLDWYRWNLFRRNGEMVAFFYPGIKIRG